jgi:hypothetical protein
MGACQSSAATVDPVAIKGSNIVAREALTPDSDATAADSLVSSVSTEEKKKKSNYLKSKHSPCGSSNIGDDSDGVTFSSRHARICEWKEELAADGNLTQAVVHIEVGFKIHHSILILY